MVAFSTRRNPRDPKVTSARGRALADLNPSSPSALGCERTTSGSAISVLRLPHRAVRPRRALVCGPSPLLPLCKHAGRSSKLVSLTLSLELLLQFTTNSLAAATIC